MKRLNPFSRKDARKKTSSTNKGLNVKTGDMAIVIGGVARGCIVKVGAFIKAGSFYPYNGQPYHVSKDSWECFAQGRKIKFYISTTRNGQEIKRETHESATAPIEDNLLRKLVSLDADEHDKLEKETPVALKKQQTVQR